MKLFKCEHCGHPVYFQNYFCVQCHASLGFNPQQMELIALEQDAGNNILFYTKKRKDRAPVHRYKFCINKQFNVCNWLLPFESELQYCIACNLNRTIPDLGQADHWEKSARIEMAKHRLIYSLLRLRLPVISKFQDEINGLAFDFKAENKWGNERLLTGHDSGVITLNIDEADDAIREMARNQMDEVYRTLLGHFRHEIGHYYWDQLIKNSNRLQAFRQLFGDESIDYGHALQTHYNNIASDKWTEHYISSYAGAHPWEDWAETWAHYLHIVDTLETAFSFGIKIKPGVTKRENVMSARLNIDPYTAKSFNKIIGRWIPLSFVMNSLNRSMGIKDSYPFVITEAVKKKLNFIHETIRSE